VTDHLDLQGRSGVRVETPPVRALRDNQIAWRIRAASQCRSSLDLILNGRAISKSVMTGDAPAILSPRRFRSLSGFLLHPEEPRLPDTDLAWLAVDYPQREAAVPWLVWFVVISIVISTAVGFLTARVQS